MLSSSKLKTEIAPMHPGAADAVRLRFPSARHSYTERVCIVRAHKPSTSEKGIQYSLKR